MGGKNTTTNTASSTSAAPQATAAYSSLLNQASNVAATPYQAYTGELTAPVNAEQTTGISGINAASGQAQPGLAAASTAAGAATAPITAAQIQQYQNPYTQQVVNATEAQNNLTNQQQQANLTGNSIAQGALGGNRVGVAQANLGAQQSIANNAQIANLYSSGYQQALGAAQAQQQTGLAGANAQANFAVQGQNAALTGAGAQLGAGTVQQQTQQAADTANQAAYTQQQAYPFQTTQWLAGIDTGVAPGLGSTSTGQTTAPTPNQTAQYAGLGLAAASFLARGGRVGVGYANGGSVQHLAGGGVSGTPWSGGPSWVPSVTGLGNAAPHAGSAPSAQTPTAPTFDYSKIISANNADTNGLASGPTYGGGNILTDANGGSSSNPLPGLDASDYGAGFARGGVASVRPRFADGGAPDDPFGDDNRQIAYDLLRQGQGVSAPATIPGGEPAPSQGVAPAVWNPDEPYRMPDQASVDDWRQNNPVPPLGVSPASATDEGGPLPPEITGGSSGAPTGVGGADTSALGYAGQPYTTNPAGAYAAPISTPSTTPPSKGDGLPNLGLLNISPNARSGLLAAGLGMLASRSSNFGNAVGEGGLHGLEAYSAANQHDQQVADAAAKLSTEAKKTADDLALRTKTEAETERHNKAGEANAADKVKFSPAGSVISADGSVHPLVMDQYSGKIIDAITQKPPKPDDKVSPKGEKPVVSDEDAKAVAERYVKTGDRTQLQGLGVSGAARQKVNHYIGEVQKDLGVSDEDLGTKVAEFEGRKASQRALGTQEAKMGSAAFEAEGAIKQARGVIERLHRTSFLPFNKLIQGYQSNTLNPDQAELAARTQAIINTYSAVMARGANVTTDSSRHHAEALLNTAGDAETYNRTLDTMLQEINMAKGSPAKMREFYRQQYGAGAVSEPSATAQPGATPAAASTGTFTPPPGAIPRQANGKTYYYDPATKQPYPGQ